MFGIQRLGKLGLNSAFFVIVSLLLPGKRCMTAYLLGWTGEKETSVESQKQYLVTVRDT